MGIGDSVKTHPWSFVYMVHSGYGEGFPTAWNNSQPKELLNAIFNGAIVAPATVRATPRDLWGNVKIPRIEHYERLNTTNKDKDGWFSTKDGVANSYTSIIGIPIELGVNASGYINHTMSIHTPYLYVNCKLNATSGYQSQIQGRPKDPLFKNGTRAYNSTQETKPIDPDFAQQFVGTAAGIFTQKSRTDVDLRDLKPLTLRYAANTRKEDRDFTLTCQVTGSYAETEVICPRSSTCAATRVRRSKLSQLPANWTFLDAHQENLGLLGNFLNSSASEENKVNLIDRYLSDPSMKINPSNLDYVEKRTSEENYSIRLGQLLNSYFTASNGLYAITGGIGVNNSNDTVYRWDSNQSFIPERRDGKRGLQGPFWNETDNTLSFNFTGETTMKAKVWTVEGSRSTLTQTIIAQRPWVAALSIASNVLILASLISPLVHHFLIKGPEVMVNISGLAARNNPHIPLPEGGTFLEASDRARMLKRVQVRFGDCESKASVGNLVIGAVDTNELAIARIKRGRIYE
ncbi:hypothetical protein E8E12_009687 [Didymella heteroderae]|uniref:Uncharacterized protein n=1 Tax=Didymella heteroderae TaxID=1769908 RepID=A0A9P5C3G4_9PLEO|nr:hypothetical protein E8E12_009687 [Didymella heteroderae]